MSQNFVSMFSSDIQCCSGKRRGYILSRHLLERDAVEIEWDFDSTDTKIESVMIELGSPTENGLWRMRHGFLLGRKR